MEDVAGCSCWRKATTESDVGVCRRQERKIADADERECFCHEMRVDMQMREPDRGACVRVEAKLGAQMSNAQRHATRVRGAPELG